MLVPGAPKPSSNLPRACPTLGVGQKGCDGSLPSYLLWDWSTKEPASILAQKWGFIPMIADCLSALTILSFLFPLSLHHSFPPFFPAIQYILTDYLLWARSWARKGVSSSTERENQMLMTGQFDACIDRHSYRTCQNPELGLGGATHPDQCVEKGKTPVVKHLEG